MRFAAAFLCMVFSISACAQDSTNTPIKPKVEFKEGVHYAVLNQPIKTRNPDKIEVTAFFWYGCPHCFSLEPMLQQWGKQLSDDVILKHSPAMWGGPMELHAKAFFTAKALKSLDKLHMPIFEAMNIERKRLSSEGQIAELFEANGIDQETFKKTFNSFGVNSQVRQADSLFRNSQATSTPELLVNGQYRVSASMSGSNAKTLEVVEYLIDKIRSER